MLISYQRFDFFKTAEIDFVGEIRAEFSGGFNLLLSPFNYYYDSKKNRPAKENDGKFYYYLSDEKNRVIHVNNVPYDKFDIELEERVQDHFKAGVEAVKIGFDNFFNEQFCNDQISGRNAKAKEKERIEAEERARKEQEKEQEEQEELAKAEEKIKNKCGYIDYDILEKLLEKYNIPLHIRTKGSYRKNLLYITLRDNGNFAYTTRVKNPSFDTSPIFKLITIIQEV